VEPPSPVVSWSQAASLSRARLTASYTLEHPSRLVTQKSFNLKLRNRIDRNIDIEYIGQAHLKLEVKL
jgi:hypothetical protein